MMSRRRSKAGLPSGVSSEAFEPARDQLRQWSSEASDEQIAHIQLTIAGAPREKRAVDGRDPAHIPAVEHVVHRAAQPIVRTAFSSPNKVKKGLQRVGTSSPYRHADAKPVQRYAQGNHLRDELYREAKADDLHKEWTRTWLAFPSQLRTECVHRRSQQACFPGTRQGEIVKTWCGSITMRQIFKHFDGVSIGEIMRWQLTPGRGGVGLSIVREGLACEWGVSKIRETHLVQGHQAIDRVKGCANNRHRVRPSRPLVKGGPPGLAHSRQLSKGAQRQLEDDHSLMCRLCVGDSKGERAREIHTIISGGRDRRISALVIAGLPACCLLAACSCWVLLSSEPLRLRFFLPFFGDGSPSSPLPVG